MLRHSLEIGNSIVDLPPKRPQQWSLTITDAARKYCYVSTLEQPMNGVSVSLELRRLKTKRSLSWIWFS